METNKPGLARKTAVPLHVVVPKIFLLMPDGSFSNTGKLGRRNGGVVRPSDVGSNESACMRYYLAIPVVFGINDALGRVSADHKRTPRKQPRLVSVAINQNRNTKSR